MTENLSPKNKSLHAILSLSWQSVAYGVGTLGSQLLVYFMLPFLTRYMPQEEYGVVSVITAAFAFLNMLTNAGLPQATFRYYNNNKDEKEQQIIIGTSQFLFFLLSALPAAGILLFPKPISFLLLGSDRYAPILQIVACYLVFESMNTFGTIVLRIEVRAFMSSIHSIILITCKTGLALLFVIVYDMGVRGYWLGHLIGSFLGLLFMAWLIRKRVVFQISRKRLWDLTKYGVPLIPASLSITILRLADRYIISALAGFDQVAIYDVGYKVGTMILFLIIPFRTAWIPFAFSISDKPEASQTYRDVLTYVTAGCSFLILFVIAFRVEIVNIVAPASYTSASIIVSWVAASQLFLSAYHVFSIGAMISNKPGGLAWAALSAAGLNLLLNFLLIPYIGIFGAAIATLVGYACLAVFTYLIGKRSFNLSVDWARIGKLILADGLVLFGILTIENFSMTAWIQLAFKILALLVFPILLLLIGFMRLNQIRDALDIVKNFLNGKLPVSSER
jgi:O-antigen/teichoic acid export membrane protein